MSIVNDIEQVRKGIPGLVDETPETTRVPFDMMAEMERGAWLRARKGHGRFMRRSQESQQKSLARFD